MAFAVAALTITFAIVSVMMVVVYRVLFTVDKGVFIDERRRPPCRGCIDDTGRCSDGIAIMVQVQRRTVAVAYGDGQGRRLYPRHGAFESRCKRVSERVSLVVKQGVVAFERPVAPRSEAASRAYLVADRYRLTAPARIQKVLVFFAAAAAAACYATVHGRVVDYSIVMSACQFF